MSAITHPELIAARAMAHRDELRALPNAIRVGVEMLLEDDLHREAGEVEGMNPYRRAALHELVQAACWRLYAITTGIVGEDDSQAPGALLGGDA